VNAVFADTYYFLALLNRADQHHVQCAAAARRLKAEVITTDWVLMEVADALAESSTRGKIAPFIRGLAGDSKVKIIRANEDLFERGLQLYEKRLDKKWSLTDCTSFVAMEDEKITDALTGDLHFNQAGFNALLAG
jgi:uncharacterized protein